MSRRLGASLEFHIRHARDILVLDELGEQPNGVSEDDWSKYNDVISIASRQAGDLLTRIRDRAIVTLGSAVTVVSKSSPRKTSKWWDAWFEFKLRGNRKRPIGWIGALVGTDAYRGDILVVYMRAKGGETRELYLIEALRKHGVVMEDVNRRVVDGNPAPLCVIQLTPELDADDLIATAVAAIEKAAPHLALCGEMG